jgi:YidC/Oxa1 family membrane protein insertase
LIAAWYAPEWLIAPMKTILEWSMEQTGNYGVAIIILTVAVRVIILPLTIYQTKSMKKMQEVQPFMKELQAKFKDQPEKLNKEMMELYKTKGVNPFSGCLPLIVQMPFLYAIFAVLQNFDPSPYYPGFLWIADLNAKDPYLAGLTVVSMFVQSYLSGAGNDPNQKIMLYMMPLLFGYISFQMPQSGVVLYWVISTVFGLIQQSIYPGFPRFKTDVGAKGA